MIRKLTAVWLLICMVLCLCGCDAAELSSETDTSILITETEPLPAEITAPETELTSTSEMQPSDTTAEESETFVLTTAPEDTALPPSVEKDGSYTTPEDVAEYIHTFGTLPANFITKKEAQALGWDSSKGNLWDVAPGMSIGGDHFGNYEGLLPEGDYHECDVNYAGGYRGAERIIYDDDGSIWYTNDHYKSFEQLY